MISDAVRRWLLGLLLVSLTGEAAAAAPAVRVEGAWCWPSAMDARTAFVYLTLMLEDEPDDRLLRAAAPEAGEVRLLAPTGHRMLPVEAVALDSHAPTILQPEATHIILHRLKQRLRPGDTVELTLDFARAPPVTLPVKVLRDPPGTGMPNLPKGIRLE